jgi:hypothetical protein
MNPRRTDGGASSAPSGSSCVGRPRSTSGYRNRHLRAVGASYRERRVRAATVLGAISGVFTYLGSVSMRRFASRFCSALPSPMISVSIERASFGAPMSMYALARCSFVSISDFVAA